MLRTVAEVVEVLMVEIIDFDRHPEILRGYHFLTLLSSLSLERAYAAESSSPGVTEEFT
jgi:hypothetical protein